MQQIALRLGVALLTFILGVASAFSWLVISTYRRTVPQAREAALRDNLFQMRKMIDQYAADKGMLPQSLGDLVAAGYIREIPADPVTGVPDWVVEWGVDPNSTAGGVGIVNVCSSSSEAGTDGSIYSDCTRW